MKYDFSGWATRNDLKCSDGRTIRKDAFAHNDGCVVPLVWNHQHNDVNNILGQAKLENRPTGVYAYCTFNDTPNGKNAKSLVQHGDISSLSIYANKLREVHGDVIHGVIREVSLVLSGANPGAFIEDVLTHSDEDDYDAVIYSGEHLELMHAEDEPKEESKAKEKVQEEEKVAANEEKTVKDVFDSLTEEQKNVVYFLIGEAAKGTGAKGDNEEEDDEDMKHNVFDGSNEYMASNDELTHSQLATIISDGKRFGSLKESFLQHTQEYGIENITYLFPDAKNYTNTPEFIKRETDWVQKVMNGTHHTPFSRIKTMFADLREDEARARGYIKGKLKKEEVFSLLKRTVDPQTIYKKQKLDRDDVVDITDFDVVAWLKGEMRIMLDEEIARAILVGDDRLSSSDDKISESHIIPIWKDADLYTIKKTVTPATGETRAHAFITAAIKARKDYQGTGNPTLFTTEDMLTEMLLLEDGIGHFLYPNESVLATTLRVKEIITVPVMEGISHPRTANSVNYLPLGIIVNLADYNVGADKGGAINMFDDFDIDYNQQKYLIETRCSGALVKPFSAIALEEVQTTSGT